MLSLAGKIRPSTHRDRKSVGRATLLLLAVLLLTACTSYSRLPYDYYYRDALDELGPALATIRVLFALGGLALLVAGWKIYRFVVALPGFLIGLVVGAALGYGTSENWLLAIVGLVLGGVVGAWLALVLHDLAVFVVGAIIGAIIVGSLWAMSADSMPPALLLIVGAIIGGGALLALAHLWIVVLSSAVGAVLFGIGIGAGVGWMFLFFLMGIAVQYGLAHAIGEKIPGPQESRRRRASSERSASTFDDVAERTPQVNEDSSREPLLLSTATLVGANGERIPIADGCQIGRGSGCDLRLPDRAVSRQHARIRYAQGAWFLQDMDSTGGTFVNDQKVAAVRLSPGDRIQIGPNEFVFYVEDSRLHG